MELDDILPDVGDYGKYQLLILCCLCLPLCFFSGMQSFVQLFLSAPPKDYWCRIPGLSGYNKSVQLSLGIPAKNESSDDGLSEVIYSRCYSYKPEYFSPFLQNNSDWSSNFSERDVVSCQDGWQYEAESLSIVETWDLVCAHDWYPTLALFIFTLGSVCGLMAFGAMSDFFGRKMAIFCCLSVQVTFGTASAFAPTFAIWCVTRFLVGLTIPSSLRIPMIYAIELVRPEKRTRVGILCSGFYSLGTISLAGLAFLLPEWRRLTLCVTLPEIAILLTWWLVPESPRWLLAKKRSVEIKDFLRFTAKVNGKILGSNTFNKLDLLLDHEGKASPPSATPADLFRSPNMRKKTLLITFIWFSNISVYMGLSYYSPSLGGTQIYLTYLLSMVMEIPAYPAVWFLTEKLGRRLPLCLSMVCGGVLCVVTVALPENNPKAILTMFLLGKFCISASFFVICIYAGELYPTVIRGIGLATSATIATLGVCLGPIIIHLGKDYMTLPLAIFGVLAILGAFLSLFLPETWHQKLPETLAEGEEFGKSGGMFDEFRLRTELIRTGVGLQKSTARMAAQDKTNTDILDQLNVENAEEEVVFDQVAHFRSFPQPAGKRKAPLSRLNSARGLISAQDPTF